MRAVTVRKYGKALRILLRQKRRRLLIGLGHVPAVFATLALLAETPYGALTVAYDDSISFHLTQHEHIFRDKASEYLKMQVIVAKLKGDEGTATGILTHSVLI